MGRRTQPTRRRESERKNKGRLREFHAVSHDLHPYSPFSTLISRTRPLGASGAGAQLTEKAQDSAVREATFDLSRRVLAQAQSDAEQSQAMFSRVDSAMEFILGQYQIAVQQHLTVVTRERALLAEHAAIAAGAPSSMTMSGIGGGLSRSIPPAGESGARLLRLAMTESDTQLERMNVAHARAQAAAKAAIEARAAATLARSRADAERGQGGQSSRPELAFPPLGLSRPVSADATATAAEQEAEAAEAKAREAAAAAPPQQSLPEADRAVKVALARAGVVFGVVNGGNKGRKGAPVVKLGAFNGMLALLRKVSLLHLLLQHVTYHSRARSHRALVLSRTELTIPHPLNPTQTKPNQITNCQLSSFVLSTWSRRDTGTCNQARACGDRRCPQHNHRRRARQLKEWKQWQECDPRSSVPATRSRRSLAHSQL